MKLPRFDWSEPKTSYFWYLLFIDVMLLDAVTGGRLTLGQMFIIGWCFNGILNMWSDNSRYRIVMLKTIIDLQERQISLLRAKGSNEV